LFCDEKRKITLRPNCKSDG